VRWCSGVRRTAVVVSSRAEAGSNDNDGEVIDCTRLMRRRTKEQMQVEAGQNTDTRYKGRAEAECETEAEAEAEAARRDSTAQHVSFHSYLTLSHRPLCGDLVKVDSRLEQPSSMIDRP
jgi:hypothetical protein